MKEEGIPDIMIKELLPVEGAQVSTSGTTTPAKSEAKKDEPKEKSKKEK